MQRSSTTLAILLCACGPNVAATSADEGGSTSDANEDDDDTFEPTATQPDPTASTITSADVTSTDSGGRDETTSTGDDPGNPFIPESDFGGGFACDLWIDDCPSGQKCMPWANDGGSAWNATKCTPLADDPNGVGEPCSIPNYQPEGIDDCEAHSMCFYVDPDTLMGECIAFCTGSESNPSCDDPCTECAINGDGVLILCLPVCDPLAQDCEEGQACYPVNDAFTCAPDAGAEMGALGDVCEFVNVCDPGLFCAPPESVPDCAGPSGCCASFCDALAEDACAGMPEGVECIPWFEEGEAPPCNSGVLGACVLPE